MSTSFQLNGERVTLDVDPEMPLLWAVREQLGLTGTKFGCGIAACGACTMHVDGVATRTCVLPGLHSGWRVSPHNRRDRAHRHT